MVNWRKFWQILKASVRPRDIPEVTIVDVVRPSRESAAADTLKYPKLRAMVELHRRYSAARQARVNQATSDVLRQKAGVALVKQRLLECALVLQDTPSQRAADDFTQASIALYGEPKVAVARQLLVAELGDLAKAAERPDIDRQLYNQVVQFYTAHAKPEYTVADTSSAQMSFLTLFDQLRQYVMSHYSEALTTVADGLPATQVLAPEMVERINRGLAVLQRQQPDWQSWRAELTDGGTLFVKGTTIFVGRNREPLSLQQLAGKFAHEVLVHAGRRVNAHRLGNSALADGLADYTTAEEGLCCLVECALLGELSRDPRERYLDIALALGTLGGKPVARKDLYTMALARRKLFKQATGNNVTAAELDAAVWERVNRVYRGTPGTDIIGVFTKDIAYHNGIKQMADYLLAELKTKSIDEVMDFLLSGKFNPLNADQAAYVQAVRDAAAKPAQ